MPAELTRKTPEEYLRQAHAEERAAARGYLKIFLGYSSGAGKSFRMFDEARRRKERGQDVVVGGVQPKVPPNVSGLLAKLEVVPMKAGGEIDVEALKWRHPAVCVIDALAFNNPPGSRNATRWQDVDELVSAGIKVIGSINIQYIAELREQVEPITGKEVSETVPVSFIKSADEIEIVDAPEEPPAGESIDLEVDAERRRRLSKLRELALVLAADVVDRQLEDYLERHALQSTLGAQERIMVCITPRANAKEMIESGRNLADRFHGELIVAYVSQAEISENDRAALEERLDIARHAGATIEMLDGDDAVEAILSFARSRGITQLFIGHSQRSGMWARMWGNPVEKLIRGSHGMDVRIFPQ
jgi:two-component system sensor histidine kinase KdpD